VFLFMDLIEESILGFPVLDSFLDRDLNWSWTSVDSTSRFISRDPHVDMLPRERAETGFSFTAP